MPSSSTHVTITGNCAWTPELKQTDQGVPWLSFKVAVNARVQEEGTWKDGPTSWYTVRCWRELATHVAESVEKGNRVIVDGSLVISEWTTRDGEKRTSAEITADDVGLSLLWVHTKPLEPARRGARAENPWEADGR